VNLPSVARTRIIQHCVIFVSFVGADVFFFFLHDCVKTQTDCCNSNIVVNPLNPAFG